MHPQPLPLSQPLSIFNDRLHSLDQFSRIEADVSSTLDSTFVPSYFRLRDTPLTDSHLVLQQCGQVKHSSLLPNLSALTEESNQSGSSQSLTLLKPNDLLDALQHAPYQQHAHMHPLTLWFIASDSEQAKQLQKRFADRFKTQLIDESSLVEYALIHCKADNAHSKLHSIVQSLLTGASVTSNDMIQLLEFYLVDNPRCSSYGYTLSLHALQHANLDSITESTKSARGVWPPRYIVDIQCTESPRLESFKQIEAFIASIDDESPHTTDTARPSLSTQTMITVTGAGEQLTDRKRRRKSSSAQQSRDWSDRLTVAQAHCFVADPVACKTSELHYRTSVRPVLAAYIATLSASMHRLIVLDLAAQSVDDCLHIISTALDANDRLLALTRPRLLSRIANASLTSNDKGTGSHSSTDTAATTRPASRGGDGLQAMQVHSSYELDLIPSVTEIEVPKTHRRDSSHASTMILPSTVRIDEAYSVWQRFDCVHYSLHSGKPDVLIQGVNQHALSFNGLVYLFVNAENMHTFENDPLRFTQMVPDGLSRHFALALIGASCTGKSSVAKLVRERIDWSIFSDFDAFLAIEPQSLIDKRYILDGFPTDVAQLQALTAKGHVVHHIVQLIVDEVELLPPRNRKRTQTTVDQSAVSSSAVAAATETAAHSVIAAPKSSEADEELMDRAFDYQDTALPALALHVATMTEQPKISSVQCTAATTIESIYIQCRANVDSVFKWLYARSMQVHPSILSSEEKKGLLKKDDSLKTSTSPSSCLLAYNCPATGAATTYCPVCLISANVYVNSTHADSGFQVRMLNHTYACCSSNCVNRWLTEHNQGSRSKYDLFSYATNHPLHHVHPPAMRSLVLAPKGAGSEKAVAILSEQCGVQAFSLSQSIYSEIKRIAEALMNGTHVAKTESRSGSAKSVRFDATVTKSDAGEDTHSASKNKKLLKHLVKLDLSTAAWHDIESAVNEVIEDQWLTLHEIDSLITHAFTSHLSNKSFGYVCLMDLHSPLLTQRLALLINDSAQSWNWQPHLIVPVALVLQNDEDSIASNSNAIEESCIQSLLTMDRDRRIVSGQTHWSMESQRRQAVHHTLQAKSRPTTARSAGRDAASAAAAAASIASAAAAKLAALTSPTKGKKTKAAQAAAAQAEAAAAAAAQAELDAAAVAKEESDRASAAAAAAAAAAADMDEQMRKERAVLDDVRDAILPVWQQSFAAQQQCLLALIAASHACTAPLPALASNADSIQVRTHAFAVTQCIDEFVAAAQAQFMPVHELKLRDAKELLHSGAATLSHFGSFCPVASADGFRFDCAECENDNDDDDDVHCLYWNSIIVLTHSSTAMQRLRRNVRAFMSSTLIATASTSARLVFVSGASFGFVKQLADMLNMHAIDLQSILNSPAKNCIVSECQATLKKGDLLTLMQQARLLQFALASSLQLRSSGAVVDLNQFTLTPQQGAAFGALLHRMSIHPSVVYNLTSVPALVQHKEIEWSQMQSVDQAMQALIHSPSCVAMHTNLLRYWKKTLSNVYDLPQSSTPAQNVTSLSLLNEIATHINENEFISNASNDAHPLSLSALHASMRTQLASTLYGTHCPVAWVDDHRLFDTHAHKSSSDCSNTHTLLYARQVYSFESNEAMHKFIAKPSHYTTDAHVKPLPSDRAVLVDRASDLSSLTNKHFACLGHDVVLLSHNATDMQLGSEDFACLYKQRPYKFVSSVNRVLFMAHPSRFSQVQLPPVALPADTVRVHELTPEEMLNHFRIADYTNATVSKPLIDALTALAPLASQLQHPRLSIAASACAYITLHLRAHNAASSQLPHVQQRSKDRLQRFIADCQLRHTVHSIQSTCPDSQQLECRLTLTQRKQLERYDYLINNCQTKEMALQLVQREYLN